MRPRMKTRLTILLSIAILALATASEALADPLAVSPGDGAQFTARTGQLSFAAQTALIPAPARLDFYVSRDNAVDPDGGQAGLLSNAFFTTHAGPDSAVPPLYTASPVADWPDHPGTYWWQPTYHDCILADPSCYGPVRSLTINPLPAPTQTSPANDASIPYGGHRIFSITDAPPYSHDGTHLNVEFSMSPDLATDGTFAHPLLIARPDPAGGRVYRYDFTTPFTKDPGTYYWIVERFDCAAEPDCFVTSDARSFTVADPVTPPPPPPPEVPNTRFTRHPGHHTRRHRVSFGFTSNIPGASFQCFYTQGWTPCQSPQTFRHLKPGRYRFRVRAVANGKRDPTPASFLFKVVRRHHKRH
jgi:hypothetical protein